MVPWAVAGMNVTVFLSGLDPLQLSFVLPLLSPASSTHLFTDSVGSVLCPVNQLVPVVTSFSAQIIVFDLKYPITSGYAVELFHHSKDIPATISKLDAVLDIASGEVTKKNPRYFSLLLSFPSGELTGV